MLKTPALSFFLLLSSCASLSGSSGDLHYTAFGDQPSNDTLTQESAHPDPSDPGESQDIVLGMKMPQVRAVWGDPAEIQVAGTSESGNQKWIYVNGVTSPYWSGGLTQSRVVYFERGRVVGWENPR